MPEIAQGSLSFLALILTAVSAWLQMLGGRPNGRLFYRLWFPIFFSTSVILISLLSNNFHVIYLLFYPYYLTVTHLGHTRFWERLVECLLYGLMGITVCFYTHAWMLFIMQMVLCVFAAVIGHFFNQKPAPKVELLVNFLRVALIAYGVS